VWPNGQQSSGAIGPALDNSVTRRAQVFLQDNKIQFCSPGQVHATANCVGDGHLASDCRLLPRDPMRTECPLPFHSFTLNMYGKNVEVDLELQRVKNPTKRADFKKTSIQISF
jgi:hypothetical protein